jgi:cation diffusion facilitator CzcD-associated flavoprotein CzcO
VNHLHITNTSNPGAGPSGLVAAKTLIHSHPSRFDITVYEQSSRIGGLWPSSQIDEGLVNPDMCTNQSRHTVSFSDLAWPSTAPVTPKAWQVGQYLQRYITTYPGYEILFNHKVLETDLIDGKWKVQVLDSVKNEVENGVFDHVVVSTGFFGKPIIPDGIPQGFGAPILHSSSFRSLKGLLTDIGRKDPRGKHIVVVGGQMSGVETAASVAMQLSTAVNSPEKSDIANIEDYDIIHVVQQPFWVMPMLFPNNPKFFVGEGGKEKVLTQSQHILIECEG